MTAPPAAAPTLPAAITAAGLTFAPLAPPHAGWIYRTASRTDDGPRPVLNGLTAALLDHAAAETARADAMLDAATTATRGLDAAVRANELGDAMIAELSARVATLTAENAQMRDAMQWAADGLRHTPGTMTTAGVRFAVELLDAVRRGTAPAPGTPSLVADARTLARFILGHWPGLEDGLRWPEASDHPERVPVYAAAQRVTTATAAGVPA